MKDPNERIILFTDEWGGKHITERKMITPDRLSHFIEVYGAKLNLQELDDIKEANLIE